MASAVASFSKDEIFPLSVSGMYGICGLFLCSTVEVVGHRANTSALASLLTTELSSNILTVAVPTAALDVGVGVGVGAGSRLPISCCLCRRATATWLTLSLTLTLTLTTPPQQP